MVGGGQKNLKIKLSKQSEMKISQLPCGMSVRGEALGSLSRMF
jgi:hypothetical protein